MFGSKQKHQGCEIKSASQFAPFHIEYQVSNEQPHGYYKQYYENGKLNLVGQFENGKESGIWKKYTDKGELFDENYYNKLKKLNK